MTIDPQQFERHVHDALAHYANSARLQASPLLAELTLSDLPLAERVGRLRELLRSAVQALRPPDAVPLSEPEWLPYRVLWARCIQRQSWVRICQEMSLSRATYYRYQAQAMTCAARALRSLLGDGAQPALSAPADALPPADTGASERAVEEAVRLAQTSRREAVDVPALLGQVERIVSGLLEQSGLRLELEVPTGLPPALGDPTVLRQIFVNLLAGAARLAEDSAPTFASPASLALVADLGEGRLAWRLEGVAAGEEPLEFRIARRLVRAYEGIFATVDAPCGQTVRFTLPVARPITILMVDDDEDTLNLYRRYLSRAGYALQAVRSGELVWESLQAGTPDLILLDVLMPREDGWLVLQRLQTLPETASIPVVVASVLAQPDLALALGARGVVSKPISEAALLAAVSSALEGSVGSP